jgi:hypothetical protein
MRNHRSYWYCGLVGGVALVALGPAQMASPFTSNTSPHAPMVRIYGPEGVPVRGPHNESTSGNWSGYALSTGTYTSASIAWTVPTVTFINYASTPGYESSSTWVGIGGFDTSDLIQLGTEQFIESNGTTTYRAWTEVLPASEAILSGCTPAGKSSCPVSPGDAMTASLTCTSNCTANNASTTWTLAMTDSTQGWNYSGNFTYKSCLCSAEWIQEAPTYSNIVPMPNYGRAEFSSLTVNGGSPGLSLSADGIILQDCQGQSCSASTYGGWSTPCGAFNGNSFLTSYGQTCDNVVLSRNFNNDDTSDILWRDNSGNLALWEMRGTTILNENTAGFGGVPTAWSIIGQRDFNGDGNADMLWRDTSGDLAIWEMSGTTILNENTAGLGNVPTNWSVVGVGDFNGDGRADMLWRDTSGDLAIWEMNGATILNANAAGVGNVPTNWSVVGVGDFNGDGMADILWRNNTNGNVAIWLMNGTTLTNSSTTGVGNMPLAWSVAGTGDFNGDGKSDILWLDTSGDIAIWEMNGTTILNPSSTGVGTISTVWGVSGVGDFNGDGKSDILWRDTSGDVAIWYMNGTTISSGPGLGTIPTTQTIQNTNAD